MVLVWHRAVVRAADSHRAAEGPTRQRRHDPRISDISAGFETGIHDCDIAAVALDDGDGVNENSGIGDALGREGDCSLVHIRSELDTAKEIVGCRSGGGFDVDNVIELGVIEFCGQVNRAAAATARVIEKLDPILFAGRQTGDVL